MSDNSKQTEAVPPFAPPAGYAFACLICGAEVPTYAPRFCCTGRDCGCGGMPVEPCTCSRECDDALFSNIGMTMEARRNKAGIPDRRHNNPAEGRPHE